MESTQTAQQIANRAHNEKYKTVRLRNRTYRRLRALSQVLDVTMISLIDGWVSREEAERGIERDVSRMLNLADG